MAGTDALMKHQNSPIFLGKNMIANANIAYTIEKIASEYVKSVK